MRVRCRLLFLIAVFLVIFPSRTLAEKSKQNEDRHITRYIIDKSLPNQIYLSINQSVLDSIDEELELRKKSSTKLIKSKMAYADSKIYSGDIRENCYGDFVCRQYVHVLQFYDSKYTKEQWQGSLSRVSKNFSVFFDTFEGIKDQSLKSFSDICSSEAVSQRALWDRAIRNVNVASIAIHENKIDNLSIEIILGLYELSIDEENSAFVSSWYEECKNINYKESAFEDIWLLTQHAIDSPDLQSNMLDLLVKRGGKKMRPKIALLTDRITMQLYNYQNYGTQLGCIAGKFSTPNVVNPQHLDAKRKDYELEPISQYVARFPASC